jgi:hypothetical protein
MLLKYLHTKLYIKKIYIFYNYVYIHLNRNSFELFNRNKKNFQNQCIIY